VSGTHLCMKTLGGTSLAIGNGRMLGSRAASVRRLHDQPSGGFTLGAAQPACQPKTHCTRGGGCPRCQEGQRDVGDQSSRERSADGRETGPDRISSRDFDVLW
jgi:hypothetical protein